MRPSLKDILMAEKVPEMSRGELQSYVDNWLFEIRPEYAPTEGQARALIAAISERPDVDDCADLLASCRDYLGKGRRRRGWSWSWPWGWPSPSP